MSERFEFKKILTKSDTTYIYTAFDTLKQVDVTVKKLTLNESMIVTKIIEEIISLYSLRPYPYFCNIVHHFIDLDNLKIKSINIVTKYYERGNLCEELIRRNKIQEFYSEAEIYEHTKTLLQGCSTMQQLGIYHRDLKPDNILIDDEGKFKIGDLGSSCLIESSSTIIGSPSYMSPEMRKRMRFIMSGRLQGFEHFDLGLSDVWSLGVTLLFMITLEPQTDFQSVDNIEERIEVKLNKIQYSVMKDLLSKMLVVDPNKRENFEGLLSWFAYETQILSDDELLPINLTTTESEMNLRLRRPKLEINQLYSIAIKPTVQRMNTSKLLPQINCKSCDISKVFYTCFICGFTIHTPCLKSDFDSCPKCKSMINYKKIILHCENCLQTFRGDQIKEGCMHRLCSLCQIENFPCQFCFGFEFFQQMEGDTSQLNSLPCAKCENLMTLKGKVLSCDTDKINNCIGCKRRPHERPCIQYDNRQVIPCINCESTIQRPEPGFIVFCKRCNYHYCYVCGNSVNSQSHLNCSKIYSINL